MNKALKTQISKFKKSLEFSRQIVSVRSFFSFKEEEENKKQSFVAKFLWNSK